MLAIGIAFAVFYSGVALLLGAFEHINVLSMLVTALTKPSKTKKS